MSNRFERCLGVGLFVTCFVFAKDVPAYWLALGFGKNKELLRKKQKAYNLVGKCLSFSQKIGKLANYIMR